MRVLTRIALVIACLVAGHGAALAQGTVAGVVRDASGAVLPGVTVEAASPALIEKVRTAVSDGTGRYRIEDLRPGELHHHLYADRLRHREARGAPGERIRGHRGRRRDARRRRPGDDHRQRRDAGRRHAEHASRDHARQRDVAEPAERAQLQLPVDHRAGVADQRQQRQHRPGVRDVPDPRRPRRRVAPDGGRAEHQQPAGRQPAAELHRRRRQRAGNHDAYVGRPGRD